MKFEEEIIAANRGERLDVFLARELARSRAQVQRLLGVNGKVQLLPHSEKLSPSYRLRRGDSIVVAEDIDEPVSARPEAEKIPLNVIFEDATLIVLNKPPGLVVHPAVGHGNGTLVNALIYHCGENLSEGSGEGRPGLVHRLDKDTSGVIVVAKTDVAHAHLADQFANRNIKKKYLALCVGKFRYQTGSCKGSIGRHPINRQKMAVRLRDGKEAHTDYRVLEQTPLAAMVECTLHTGRTHQIRVHLSHLGYPILGDEIYGKPLSKTWNIQVPRQMLHAYELGFEHPRSGKWVEFKASLPEDFELCLSELRKLATEPSPSVKNGKKS